MPYVSLACNVADCDDKLGHCLVGRIDLAKQCSYENKMIWIDANATTKSCIKGAFRNSLEWVSTCNILYSYITGKYSR